MHVPTGRSVVIISGLLTLLVLSGGALALGFHNGWLRTGTGVPTPDAVSPDSRPTHTGIDRVAPAAAEPSVTNPAHAAAEGEAGAYQQRLDEAYRALDDAYAQIRVLQSPPVSLASGDGRDERITNHDGDDDDRERRPRHRDSDDHRDVTPAARRRGR